MGWQSRSGSPTVARCRCTPSSPASSSKIMGSAYGAVFLASTLGMGLGSFAGGALYDRFGSYLWLYIGSGSIGLAAVMLALTFRQPRPLTRHGTPVAAVV